MALTAAEIVCGRQHIELSRPDYPGKGRMGRPRQGGGASTRVSPGKSAHKGAVIAASAGTSARQETVITACACIAAHTVAVRATYKYT